MGSALFTSSHRRFESSNESPAEDLRDAVNPYGGGGPKYWGDSAPMAVQAGAEWSHGHGCVGNPPPNLNGGGR